MEIVRSTPVTRSWGNTLVSLLFGVALLALGSFLFYENRGVNGVIGTVVLAMFSIMGLWGAITNSYTGECPACGSAQKRLGGLHRCGHCLAYGEVVKGEYRELESDRVFH